MINDVVIWYTRENIVDSCFKEISSFVSFAFWLRQEVRASSRLAENRSRSNPRWRHPSVCGLLFVIMAVSILLFLQTEVAIFGPLGTLEFYPVYLSCLSQQLSLSSKTENGQKISWKKKKKKTKWPFLDDSVTKRLHGILELVIFWLLIKKVVHDSSNTHRVYLFQFK